MTEELTHGGRIVRFEYEGIFLEVLESGEMPLPHIFTKNWMTVTRQSMPRVDQQQPQLQVAFYQELLEEIQQRGSSSLPALHVGLGTFGACFSR